VADESKKVKKPRIRKTAPTVRERAEIAQAKASKEKPKRIRKVLAKAPKPTRRLHLPNNKVFATIKRILQPLGKILSRLAPRYFANAWRELRQVTWPNRGETWRLTLAVFIFAIVFGALVAGVDKGLDTIFKNFVIK
jgi:preprotein translocase SecE subunit